MAEAEALDSVNLENLLGSLEPETAPPVETTYLDELDIAPDTFEGELFRACGGLSLVDMKDVRDILVEDIPDNLNLLGVDYSENYALNVVPRADHYTQRYNNRLQFEIFNVNTVVVVFPNKHHVYIHYYKPGGEPGDGDPKCATFRNFKDFLQCAFANGADVPKRLDMLKVAPMNSAPLGAKVLSVNALLDLCGYRVASSGELLVTDDEYRRQAYLAKQYKEHAGVLKDMLYRTLSSHDYNVYVAPIDEKLRMLE